VLALTWFSRLGPIFEAILIPDLDLDPDHHLALARRYIVMSLVHSMREESKRGE